MNSTKAMNRSEIYALPLEERKRELILLLKTFKSQRIFGDDVDQFMGKYTTFRSFQKRVSKELMEFILDNRRRVYLQLEVPGCLVNELKPYCRPTFDGKVLLETDMTRELLIVMDMTHTVFMIDSCIDYIDKSLAEEPVSLGLFIMDLTWGLNLFNFRLFFWNIII